MGTDVEMATIIETLETMLEGERNHKPVNDSDEAWRGALMVGLEQAVRALHGVACLQEYRDKSVVNSGELIRN